MDLDRVTEPVCLYSGPAREAARLYPQNVNVQAALALAGVTVASAQMAPVAAAMELDLNFAVVQESLRTFSGVQRRFQIKGEPGGIMVVDDYGHHPEEIKATLSAAKSGWARRTVVIFQPHRYTRTRDLLREFFTAFNQADMLFLLDIYPAGEDPIAGVKAENLYEGIKGHGHKDITLVHDKNEIPDLLLPRLKSGDMVLTLGAGDVWKIGEALLQELKTKYGT